MEQVKKDDELGVNREECFAAAERLKPCIQAMIDAKYPLVVVTQAWADAFLGCLKAAGASKWYLEKMANRMAKYWQKSGRMEVEDAYGYISPEITTMIDDGFDPLAIAYALAGLGSQLVPPKLSDKLLIELLKHINATRAAMDKAA